MLAVITVIVVAGLIATVLSSVLRNEQILIALPASTLTAVPALVLLLLLRLAFGLPTGFLIACLVLIFTARFLVIVDRANGPAPGDGPKPARSGVIVAHAFREAACLVALFVAVDFLGAGAAEPTPSWGLLLNTGESLSHDDPPLPWLLTYPGGAVASLMLGFSLIAYGIERRVRREA